MFIRTETEADYTNIYNLVKIAFQTAKVSNGKEQDYVNQLRASGNYIPELALIAEKNGEILGHIMLTKTHITNGDKKYEALLLAPLSVVLAHRNKGVGSKLICDSFELAKKMGYLSVIVVGDPAYYQRFGFKPSAEFGIRNIDNIPDMYVMACELAANALKNTGGDISFS